MSSIFLSFSLLPLSFRSYLSRIHSFTFAQCESRSHSKDVARPKMYLLQPIDDTNIHGRHTFNHSLFACGCLWRFLFSISFYVPIYNIMALCTSFCLCSKVNIKTFWLTKCSYVWVHMQFDIKRMNIYECMRECFCVYIAVCLKYKYADEQNGKKNKIELIELVFQLKWS